MVASSSLLLSLAILGFSAQGGLTTALDRYEPASPTSTTAATVQQFRKPEIPQEAEISVPSQAPEAVDEFEDSWSRDAVQSARSTAESQGIEAALSLGFLFPDTSALSRIASELGFPGRGSGAFQERLMEVGGIRFAGQPGKHFRIGAYFSQGSLISRHDYVDLARELELQFNQAGVTLAFVWPLQRWEFSAGGLLGTAALTLNYRQVDRQRRGSKQTWGDIVHEQARGENSKTYGKSLQNIFFSATPWLGGRFRVTPWFAVGTEVGYLLGTAGARNWSFSDSIHALDGGQAVPFRGLSTRLEAVFGLFPLGGESNKGKPFPSR